MPITGLSFLLFALAAVVLYYLFPKRLRQYVLLAASILFYLTYGVRMAGYLAATILLTYLFGLWLDRLAAFRPAAETKEERKRQKRANDRKKRRVLALSLVLNFASLALLKYGGFLASSVNAVLGTELPLPHFLLPLGISFYIFQTSAYLIDISRGKHRAERGFLRYALFVCYFPQLVQGPINRFADLQPQLTEGNDFSWDNIQHGFLRMLYGVLKKAMIADTLAPIVAKIYGDYAAYPGIICFLGAALYCIQLYCDFSGGIDLMMGISRLFGISMQENFCRPSTSSASCLQALPLRWKSCPPSERTRKCRRPLTSFCRKAGPMTSGCATWNPSAACRTILRSTVRTTFQRRPIQRSLTSSAVPGMSPRSAKCAAKRGRS